MLFDISIVLAGYSIISSLMLCFAYCFFLPEMRKSIGSKNACVILLVGLVVLQIFHLDFFLNNKGALDARGYCLVLLALPPAFYFFARTIVFPEFKASIFDFVHWAPIVLALFLNTKFIPGIAFMIGSIYTLFFAKAIFQVRKVTNRYNFERFFFSMFAIMALAAFAAAVSVPYIDHSMFYLIYANAISLALVGVMSVLLINPELMSDIREMTEIAYAKSKLGGVDTESKLRDLEKLMSIDKVYQNEDLSLISLAELLEMSSHQLSELVNTKYGKGFSQFVREQRVSEAKRMLIDEPHISILSISMSTGFRSQSNFYTAFKTATGKSPGNYRKQMVK